MTTLVVVYDPWGCPSFPEVTEGENYLFSFTAPWTSGVDGLHDIGVSDEHGEYLWWRMPPPSEGSEIKLK